MKMKRLSAVLICAAMLLAFMPCMSASAAKIVRSGKLMGSGDVSWTLYDNGTLVISGSGVIGGNAPYSEFDGIGGIKAVVIERGITRIGDYAFSACEEIVSVEIGDGVTSIGLRAFRNCAALETIIIPDSIISIGDSAFSGCYELAEVYYTGTEEQWKELSIDKYSYPLIEAEKHYGYASPIPKINDITATVEDGQIKLTVATENVSAADCVFSVGYGADGAVTAVADVLDGEAALPAETKTVKVFVWKSLVGMRPLCPPVEKTV